MFDDIVKEEKINTGPTLMKEVCEKLGVKYIDSEDIVNVQPMRDDMFNMMASCSVTWTEELDEEIRGSGLKEDDTPDPAPLFDDEIEMAWGKVGENPFADARYTMAEYFNMDEDLRFGYQCNIAMFLNDRCGITDHEERNKLAKELMKLIWE